MFDSTMMQMRLSELLIIISFNSFVCVSFAVNPVGECLAFESSYHIEKACECVVYQSYGRSQGTFTSPNFPQVYPPGIMCILYTFIGDLDEIVELSFLEFDLKVPITSKCTDFLKFYLDLERPEVNERHAWNYELCGNITMIQKKHYSSARSLIIEYHTDSVQSNHTGFRGIYRFIDKAQFQITNAEKRWGSQCTYDFYSNKNSRQGKFFSPRYPQNYPPGSNCRYVFFGMPGERVKLIFQNIQLENIDGSCSDSPDFIVVRDGMNSQSPVIAQYCNTLNSVQVTSSGEKLYVEFIVDDKKQRQGFAATYQFSKMLPPSRPPPPPRLSTSPHGLLSQTVTHSLVIPPYKGSSTSKGKNTDELGDGPSNGSHGNNPSSTIISTRPCEYRFSSVQSKNGTFSSPHFPAPYDSDITCRYTFQGQGRERVQIMFTNFDLNYPQGDPEDPYDCEDLDSVSVRINIDGEAKNIGIYCGSKRPPRLMSNDNRMEALFTARSSIALPARGFKATYKFVKDFGIKTGKQNKNMVCGFIFRSTEASNGTFTSPNFPGLYPRNTECHYLFYGQPNQRVFITFPYFDVEGIPTSCMEDTESDYVEFSNFNVELPDRKMTRFCGTNEEEKAKMVDSDGSFFRVTFKSNHLYDAAGFEAYYQFRSENGHDQLFGPRVDGNGASSLQSVSHSVISMTTMLVAIMLSTSCQLTLI